MSIVGKNIRKLRKSHQLNQTQFANLFNIKRSSIGAYEEGRARPKLEVIQKIANHFSISLEHLLDKELTINDIYQFSLTETQQPDRSPSLQEHYSIVVGAQELKNYCQHHKDRKYLGKLPYIKSDFFHLKGNRVFEISSEWCTSNWKWQKGDLAVCIIESFRQSLKPLPNAYFALTDEGLFPCILSEKDKTETLLCGNKKILKKECKEILRMEHLISSGSFFRENIDQQLNDINEKLNQLLKQERAGQ